MKTVSLSGSLRENVGKKDAKKHRREGKVVCVLYGGKEQIHFTIDEMAFSKIIFTPEVFLINLQLDGKEYSAILQDIQYHPVNDKVLHADFLEIFEDKAVTIGVPVKFEGVAPGILAGGKLFKKIRKLKVNGLVKDLPDFITINIDKLDIGSSVRVRDVVNEELEFLDTPNAVIVMVKTARGAAEDEEEEEGEGEEGAEGAEGESKEGEDSGASKDNK
ncbi:MAG: 50S ribosomal protein L25/general stress protein Ctc [Chlorobi bacterium]|nr:50S ribosomal protein L25/general stress protein Ctc [Chlorobiota bacterium]